MIPARYSKFLTQLLVTLLQIGVVYSTTMDWRVAISAVITTAVVLVVPNLPQLPWLKAALAFVGASTQVLFAISGDVTITAVLISLVAGFGALGVYAVPNESADGRHESLTTASANVADTPIEAGRPIGFTNQAPTMTITSINSLGGSEIVLTRPQATELALAFSKVEA